MENIYTGYVELELNDKQLTEVYETGTFDGAQPIENSYIAIRHNGEIVDKMKWKDGKLERIQYGSFGNHYTGTIKAKNLAQYFAMDLLQDKDSTVKLIRGVYGSGKDYLMISYALDCLDKGQYDKIIFIRPNVTVRNVPDIGFLPNGIQEKLAWTLGPLYDKVGGEDGVNMLIERNKLELMPLLFIRGRSFENSIVYVTEAQNITSEIAKLLLGRIGEGSILLMNGDTHQTDNKVYDADNGVIKMIDKLAGNKLFGYVYLNETLRSNTANLANLLDD